MTDIDDRAKFLGIQRDYLDNADEPVSLSDETIEALAAAIGTPDPGLDDRAPVVLRPGAWLDTGSSSVEGVVLESGEQRELDGSAPVDLPYGYHRLQTSTGERSLIVSPGECVLPSERIWGWTAQLYATRSTSSWGIGDLSDLGTLTRLAKAQGAGFVLVNPLHAGGSTSTQTPQQASPYFPSSRRFFSPLYLAVGEVAGAGEVLGSGVDELAASGRALLADRRIDRDAVWRIKRAALREIFDRTSAAHSPELARWRASKGQSVEDFAAWCVLSERYGATWQTWPEGARRPGGPLATEVRREAPDDIAFAIWLQWQAETQLSRAGEGVRVLQDLPIGVDPEGADAWVYQDLLAPGVTVGAPPDPFNRAGQDWGLPPFIPWKLRGVDYQPFIEAIRATMAVAGGLRIDHVMGLFRLWWVPAGSGSSHGGYVRYPFRDLLDIVALESHRSGSPVVGEDLGTVEPGVREELASRNVLSYRLLWFEEDTPAKWPVGALAAIGTHDLPTVAGIWDGSDVEDQRESGMDADEEATNRLRRFLIEKAGVATTATPAEAVTGAVGLLSAAPSLLLGASLDDALAEPRRPNMPGTSERANWSLALPVPLDDFPSHNGVNELATVLCDAVRESPVRDAPVGAPSSRAQSKPSVAGSVTPSK